MVLLGLFLLNTMCAIVPCQRLYNPPVPVRLPNSYYDEPPDGPFGFGSTTIDPVVHTQSGKVRGFRMTTIGARDVFAFRGIPYAEPPMGYMRYRASVMKKPWQGIYEAVHTPPDCLQLDGMQLLRIVGSENCLFLNVYTPKLPITEHPNLPVLIYIHGGSFAFGAGSMYGPAYLLDRDVILVTFNYRLSSLGFLSTGDTEAPGNWGLKDQNLAMKWVRNNIHYFGGNPHAITIFGQSAGAVSVHLHMMSKMSRGLFKSGISHSGNAFCFWGVRQDSVKFTQKLATKLGCPTNESRALVDCMRRQDAILIAYTESSLPEFKFFPGVFYGPMVEPPHPGAFLEFRPEEYYARNEVAPIPWVGGFLPGEGNGLGFLSWLYPLLMEEINARWNDVGGQMLDLNGDTSSMAKMVKKVREFYFGNKPINFSTRKGLTNMMGDRLIISAVHRGLQYHSKVAPTYGYFFNFTGRYGSAETYGLKNSDWGISHDDDLIYLLNSTTYPALQAGEPEHEMSEYMTNLWVNFAKHGKPMYTTLTKRDVDFWSPIQDPLNMTLNMLDGGAPRMIPVPYQHRIQFWEAYKLVSKSVVGSTTFNSFNVHMRPLTPARPPEILVPPDYFTNNNNNEVDSSTVADVEPNLYKQYTYTPFRRPYY